VHLSLVGPDADRAAGELQDALYYLRRGCRPCAQRHIDLARRFGAAEEQVQAVLASAPTGPDEPAGPA
jgi:hypothetical protein